MKLNVSGHVFLMSNSSMLLLIFSLITDNPKLNKIDPSHPTLRGFQLEYEWRDAPIEDPRFGLQVLCFSCFIGFIILVVAILVNLDFEADEVLTATAVEGTRRTTQAGSKRK